jgi:multiple sugar transport system permease protein
MRAHAQRRLTGTLYVLPALTFVVGLTVYPFIRMCWVSFHSWSLIEPPTYIGLDNFSRAFEDEQGRKSLRFTFTYTLLLTPILMVGGYLIALLTAENTRVRRFTRTVVFIPVVIGLGASSLLWYHLFSARFGLINRALEDVGVIDEPVLWLGTDTTLSLWAVMTSVIWKVLGFGMILFIAAIQAIPREIDEAATVDGANSWQRLTRITLPLTMRTVLLVTLVSAIGSLLAFDQFYIMTAGQPLNETATSVLYIYLNSFPFLKLGYGAALSLILALIIMIFTITQIVLTRRSHS